MKRRIVFMVLALVLGIGWLGLTPAAQAEELVSKPGVYSGYSPVLYDHDNNYTTINYKLNSQYVTMRDGTKLAVDIFRPTSNGQLVTTPLPVVWMHSPYNRRTYVTSLAVDLYPGAARGLIKYGYVVAVADARGLYASFGSAIGYNRGEWMKFAFWDAYDLTEWFAAQPWSNGKVGMWGCSATGETQLQAVAANPPHLKAVFPMSCSADFLGTGSGVVSNADEGKPAPDFPYWAPYNAIAVPVDEDPAGAMKAAARLEQNKGSDIGYSPYRDSVSPWVWETMGKIVRWGIDSSPSTYFHLIERSRIPMYNTGNWQDAGALRWGPLLRLQNLSNPAKVLLGPGGHCIWYTDKSPKPYPLTFRIVDEEHRWFDYWLKGIGNGIMDEPPIYMFTYNQTIGKEWRFAWQWPLPNEKRVHYYLEAGPSVGGTSGVNNGTLTTTPPSVADAKDQYLVDYTVTSTNRNQKGLTYTTAPLASDVEVTGDPVVKLWISSTAADGDFFAYLEDVAPDGSSSYFFVDGSLRASNRALHHPPYDTWGLPYHRNYEQDAKPLTPGEPVKLAFNLGTSSYIFKAGHRIRLIITCVAPTTPPAPSATPVLDPGPTVSIYRNPVYKSHLILPIGGAPIAAHVRIEPDTLNDHSHGEITAFITFPGGLDRGYLQDVKPESIQCNKATALSVKVHKDMLIAKFTRQNLTDIDTGHRINLIVTGAFGKKFDYGQLTFEGSDMIRLLK